MQVYSYDTELVSAGALSYRLATHGWWFAKPAGSTVYDTSHVSLSVVESMLAKYGSEATPLLIDIEAYDLATEPAHAVEQLRVAATTWRAGSQRSLGFYGLVPERSWFVPVRWWNAVEEGASIQRRRQMAEWRDRNTRNAAALVDCVDFLCPSLYAFYPDRWQNWRVYAEANLDEAVRVAGGKPVWPILYPSMPNQQAVPLSQWQMMVDWVASYPRVEGMMIYSPNGTQMPDGWRGVVTKHIQKDVII